MAQVKVPIQTKYDGKGFDQLRRDAERAQRDAVRATRQQIAQHRRVANLTKKLDRDLEKSAKRRRSLMESITLGAAGGIALAGGIEALATGMANFTAEAVVAAGEAERVERAFVGLSGGAEQAAANLAAMDRATKGLISTTKQQQIANQLLSMGIVETNEELEEFITASRRLGQLKGIGVDDAAEQFALLVANMSRQRLDTFGLSLEYVDERVKQLTESGEAANKQQAFFQAVLEDSRRILAEIGPEIDTVGDDVDRLGAKWADFQVSVGKLADDTDVIDWVTDFVEQLTWGVETLGNMQITFEYYSASLVNMVKNGLTWNEALEDTRERMARLHAEQQAAAAIVPVVTDAIDENTDATEENTDALEEQARRLERVNSIRQDFARDLINIDEQAAKDVENVWDEYWDDQESEWQDHNKRLADLRKRAAKEAEKSDRDLAKALTKIDKNAEKQITKVKNDAAKEQRNESRRRQVDTLADERLFNFELQQLAAEGQGNAIREAIERRAIEEEIAKEKAAVESQIEAEKQADEIASIRETATERRSQLQQDHAEEKQLREERLAEEQAAERESYDERMEELRQYREEKLVELENSKQEAVQKIAEELTEAGDLTRAELQALTQVAAQMGLDVGTAFAFGIEKGFKENQTIDEMLDATPGAPSSLTPGMPHPGLFPQFQFGGTVPGPIGQPVPIIAHGGETVSPPGQAAQSFSVTINAAGGVDQARIEALFQQFTDEVLVPALS